MNPFFKNVFQKYIGASNSLDPNQARRNRRGWFGPKLFEKLLADAESRH